MNELLQIDPATTVALTIDMQWDYLDPTRGTAPLDPDDAKRVITSSARLLDACRDRAIPVVHAYVSRRRVEAEQPTLAGKTAYSQIGERAKVSQHRTSPPRATADRIAGSHQAGIPDELVREGDVHVDSKRTQDGFHLTDLEMVLTRVFGARSLLICGINTDTCVYATTFGASNRGYAPVVVADCVASMRGRDNHWMALELMSRSIAWVLSLDEVLGKLSGAAVVQAPPEGRVTSRESQE